MNDKLYDIEPPVYSYFTFSNYILLGVCGLLVLTICYVIFQLIKKTKYTDSIEWYISDIEKTKIELHNYYKSEKLSHEILDEIIAKCLYFPKVVLPSKLNLELPTNSKTIRKIDESDNDSYSETIESLVSNMSELELYRYSGQQLSTSNKIKELLGSILDSSSLLLTDKLKTTIPNNN